MSTSTTLNSQIIQVLCNQGLTFNGLLRGLQTRFPASGWTLAQLTTLTTQGVQQGRLLRGLNGGFLVNPKMILSNVQNQVYSTSCGLDPTPCGCGSGRHACGSC